MAKAKKETVKQAQEKPAQETVKKVDREELMKQPGWSNVAPKQ